MDIKSNIKKYYWFCFFRNFSFWLPVFVLFFIDRGLNYTQIMILPVVTAVTQLILEMPTGIFADKFGRKKTILIGRICCIISLVLYYYAYSDLFILFILAAIFFGATLAFTSGTESAFIYDTLKDLKKEKLYKKIEGKALSLRWFAMGIGAFFGGFVAKISLSFTLIQLIISTIISLFIVLSFKEPKKHKKTTKGQYLLHLKESVKFAFSHKKIKWLILFYGIMIGVMVINHRFFQPYMQQTGIDLKYFGIIYMVFLFVSAIASRYAYKIEFKIGQKNSLILIPLLLIIQMFFMGKYIIIYGLIFILLDEFAWGFTFPTIKDYINRYVESYRRATILSLNGFSQSIFLIIFSPIIGYIADLYTIKEAFLFSGIFVLILSIPILYFLLKK